MPWYQGPPLLYHLEHVHIASDRNLIDVRFPVQWVIRPPAIERRRLPRLRRAGRRRRDAPGRRGRRAAGRAAHRRSPAIDTFDGPVEEAFPPMSVARAPRRRHRRRARQRRSCARTTSRRSPTASRRCSAGCQSSRSSRGRRYLVKHTTRTAMVGGVDVRYRIDVETPAPRRERRRRSSSTTSARVHLELSSPLVFDSYRRNRVTGQPDRDRRGDQRNGRRRRDPRHRGRGGAGARSRRPSAARTCAGRARA